MRRIVVRAPTCSADIIIYLKGVFRLHAEELQPNECVEFSFEVDRFPFASAVFESLLAAAGLNVLSVREEDQFRIIEVEKRQHGQA